jgi:hypothetical protein
MCGGGSDADGPGSTSGKSEGGYGGLGMGNPGSYGGKNDPGRTSEGGYSKSGGGDSSTPQGLRSIADMQAGLNIAGPQLSRARNNAAATNLSYGLRALGMMTGFVGFSAAASLVTAARDYGRGYADRTDMEKAADAIGMGAPQRGGYPVSGGLGGVARPMAKAPAKAPAKAAASGNVGSGSAGATVIMGAEKTRTGAGAGGRAKGSAVRGFGSGGLKL